MKKKNRKIPAFLLWRMRIASGARPFRLKASACPLVKPPEEGEIYWSYFITYGDEDTPVMFSGIFWRDNEEPPLSAFLEDFSAQIQKIILGFADKAKRYTLI